MHGLLEGALEEHMARLRGMTQRIADKAAADARFKELQHLEEVYIQCFQHYLQAIVHVIMGLTARMTCSRLMLGTVQAAWVAM